MSGLDVDLGTDIVACGRSRHGAFMTRSGESPYGDWGTPPPRKPLPFWWWMALATVTGMLVVAIWRGNW